MVIWHCVIGRSDIYIIEDGDTASLEKPGSGYPSRGTCPVRTDTTVVPLRKLEKSQNRQNKVTNVILRCCNARDFSFCVS